MGKFIDQLIRDGNLKLWIPPNDGHLDDLSGNNNNGATAVTSFWTRLALDCSNSGLGIEVADSAGIQLTTGALVLLGRFEQPTTIASLISKRDGGGTNYDWRMTATQIEMWEGFATKSLVMSIAGARCLAINMHGSGTPCDIYKDGLFEGPLNGNSTFTADDAPLYIAGYYAGGRNLHSPVETVLIINRVLTESEHAVLFNELADMEHTSLVDMRAIADITAAPLVPSIDLWKTNFGAQTSVAAVTSGYLGNTPFRVESGSFKISTEIIDGELVKFIECVTAGLARIPVTQFGQTPTEAAYGELDLWVNKADASDLDIILGDAIETWSGANQDGYLLRLNFAERIALTKLVGGVSTELFYTNPAEVAVDTLTWLRLTRSLAGVFTVYKNGVIVGNIAFGTNPVTDTTHTTIKYLLFDLDAGDKIAYSDPVGGHSIVKRVVS